jgi:hypothetical protein
MASFGKSGSKHTFHFWLLTAKLGSEIKQCCSIQNKRIATMCKQKKLESNFKSKMNSFRDLSLMQDTPRLSKSE